MGSTASRTGTLMVHSAYISQQDELCLGTDLALCRCRLELLLIWSSPGDDLHARFVRLELVPLRSLGFCCILTLFSIDAKLRVRRL